MPEETFVLGSGGWGTALALLLESKGNPTTLWGFEAAQVARMRETRANPDFLPGARLPGALKLVSDFSALAEAGAVVLAVPSKFMRPVLEAARPFFRPGQLLVNVAKGVEQDSLLTMSEVIRQALEPSGSGFRFQLVTLSGPSHAEEVFRGVPTTVVAASDDEKASARAQELFTTPTFRVYTSPDLKGVELGGSLKNVVALAAGIVDGLDLGDNTKAALMTRGLAEMTRLGTALGAKGATFAGLAGMGDLVVTCMSRHSRNRSVGERLGKGEKWADIQKGMVQVAEGVTTAVSSRGLAGKAGVEMPICAEVYRVLFEAKPPRQALMELMSRAPKAE